MTDVWPNDSDGDVLRRLSESGFDFSRPTVIDFNVDFEEQPSTHALNSISKAFPESSVSPEEGYVLVQLSHLLTYEFVIETQAKLSEVTAAYGGNCESWGVLVEPKSQ